AIFVSSLIFLSAQIGYEALLQAKLKSYLSGFAGLLSRLIQVALIGYIAFKVHHHDITISQAFYSILIITVIGSIVSLAYTLWIGSRYGRIEVSWVKERLKWLT